MPEPKPDLHHLFQMAGHVEPATDLTERIMARVAVTPLLRPTPVRPIMGSRAWIGIAVLTAALLLWGFFGASTEHATSGPGSTAHAIGTLLPASGNRALGLIALTVSLLVLAGCDRLLAGRQRMHQGTTPR